jgi:deazaflavin-dependent oxidoreductase (nitroreductase family)
LEAETLHERRFATETGSWAPGRLVPGLMESALDCRQGHVRLRTALARLARVLTRPRPLVTRFTRAQAWVLRASRGRIRRSAILGAGQPVLSLTTTGRRSGRARSTVVAYMAHGDSYIVTAANLGSERDPAWFLNLSSEPHAEIVVDGQRRAVVARRAAGAEARRLWARWIERLPAADVFREIAGREIPVVVLEPRDRA